MVNGKLIVLEEEVQHHKRSFSNLIKEHECLLKNKLEQDQRLQKEIRERLCLKMVSNTLVLSPVPPCLLGTQCTDRAQLKGYSMF